MNRVGAAVQAGFIKALLKCSTTKEISKVSGLSLNTVYIYLRVYHRQGVAYIESWQFNPDTRKWSARWALRTDRQADAHKPKMTSAERTKAYIERKARKLAEEFIRHGK